MGNLSKSYLKEKFLSTKGYKRNSPDVNNPYNVIPSNQITMKGVDFPVLGVDNFGNRQLMKPGSDYTFPGNYVKEFPMRNMGNNRFQDGGAKSPVILPQIDYDLEKAPKQGNFLLSDIDRPFYIDDEGWKRSEYRMGVNVDGKETLIPTVVNGTQLTEDQAIQRYYDTGLHMGQYNTVPESEYASRMRTLKYNMLEDPVRFGTNYQTGGTKKPIPRYVEDRYGYNNTTDNTYVRPYTPLPKPLPVPTTKTPTNLGNNYYQQQPTQDNLRTEFYKKLDSDYAAIAAAGPRVTPADLLRQWEDAAQAEAEERQAQSLQAERKAAAKTTQAVEDWGDENAKFTFPAGYLQSSGTTKVWKDMDWREKAYVYGRNLGSWNAGNWTDNINPVAMLGSWAEGLGSAPYVARETDSLMPYVTGIGGPLLAGALGGLGTKSTGQFVNNLVNPLAGMGPKNLGKHLTTKTPLKNVVNNTPGLPTQTWQMQELPGLHLKSTMADGPISKIVEPKTGLVNVEQALGIIAKESGGVDKVAFIKQGLGETLPKKMDYNEFRKIVQGQLIPLEKTFVNHSSNYGLERLGYKPGTFTTTEVGGRRMHTYNSDHIENQTLVLSNRNKFGRGSDAHGNPEETLGHIHFLRDAKTPDVLTVTQMQSDAFQGTHRLMAKNASDLSKYQKSLERMQKLQDRNKAVLDTMKTKGVDEAGVPVQDYQIREFEEIVKAQEQANLLQKVEIENFSQKSLLDKNHQERYLQELVNYSGERGDVSKVRLPTRETAAKVQNYKPVKTSEQVIEEYNRLKGTPEWEDLMSLTPDSDKIRLEKILKGEITGDIYDTYRETILKKYTEQPKTVKKLFGLDPKVVTDDKGNTWYEFDIPEKFKTGKGEIKAFSLGGFVSPRTTNLRTKASQKFNRQSRKSYQMGGTIGIPGVNGQVVSSGSYPLASVKKTRGSVKKDNKGNVKTMSNQQVKQVLKYSKQKPNKI